MLLGFADDGIMYGEEGTGGLQEEQRQRLLDNSERVERTGRQLSAGYRIALETEEIGTEVLRDLHSQRETIHRARSRVSNNNDNNIFVVINLQDVRVCCK